MQVKRTTLSLQSIFAVLAASLWLFGVLAEDVVEQDPFSFDPALLLYLHHQATPALDRIMVFITNAGSAAVLIPIEIALATFFLFRKRWWELKFFCVLIGGTGALNFVAKQLFARSRPDLWVSIVAEHTYSFPSGHAMHSVALACALGIFLRRTEMRYPAMMLGILFVLLIGVSRLYLGVHYPSDVLAGWSAAIAWSTAVFLLFPPQHVKN
ncbi:phosphatase PAP2 family protein [Herbaspirillum lusitanum]|uniref:phosphatase PAP2 family protein n=1 Tax=Herbaspirillum lusitanum TaxID=213312 RepID=UPI000318748A|nr:phosphatase PAP2 family protein [Herbaspirillum lusitanum]